MNKCLEHNVLNETFTAFLEKEKVFEGYREFTFAIADTSGNRFRYRIQLSDHLKPLLIEEDMVSLKTADKEIMNALVEYIKDRLDDDFFQDAEFVFSEEDIDELEKYVEKFKRPRLNETVEEEKMELLQYLRDAREELYGQEDKYIDIRIIQEDSGLNGNHLVNLLRLLAEEGKVDLYESEIEDSAARITRKGSNDLEDM